MWGMIATWSMAADGVAKGAELLKSCLLYTSPESLAWQERDRRSRKAVVPYLLQPGSFPSAYCMRGRWPGYEYEDQ